MNFLSDFCTIELEDSLEWSAFTKPVCFPESDPNTFPMHCWSLTVQRNPEKLYGSIYAPLKVAFWNFWNLYFLFKFFCGKLCIFFQNFQISLFVIFLITTLFLVTLKKYFSIKKRYWFRKFFRIFKTFLKPCLGNTTNEFCTVSPKKCSEKNVDDPIFCLGAGGNIIIQGFKKRCDADPFSTVWSDLTATANNAYILHAGINLINIWNKKIETFVKTQNFRKQSKFF